MVSRSPGLCRATPVALSAAIRDGNSRTPSHPGSGVGQQCHPRWRPRRHGGLEPVPRYPLVVGAPAPMTWRKPFTGSPGLRRSASHSGLQTVGSKDSSPVPSAGPTSNWTPNAKPAGPPGSVLRVGQEDQITEHDTHHDDDAHRSRTMYLMPQAAFTHAVLTSLQAGPELVLPASGPTR
jgi:hypothetical protein